VGQLRVFSFFEAADLTIAGALSHPTCYYVDGRFFLVGIRQLFRMFPERIKSNP
jgi:hypothetical protein